MSKLDNKIWGPIIWDILHTLATQYKNNNQTMIFRNIFLYYISEIIPCNECYKHYKNFINNINFHYSNLVYQLYLFHNSINKKLNKKEITIFEFDLLHYENKCCNNIYRNLNNLLEYYTRNNTYNYYIKKINELKKLLNDNKQLIFNNRRLIM